MITKYGTVDNKRCGKWGGTLDIGDKEKRWLRICVLANRRATVQKFTVQNEPGGNSECVRKRQFTERYYVSSTASDGYGYSNYVNNYASL